MRIGVMSDIHGNAVALDAVLADVASHPVDAWVCLGDAVQGGAQPLSVVERLGELGCPVIMGNADAFVLTGRSEAEAITDPLKAVADWTAEQLGPHGLDVLRTFVPTHEVDLGPAGSLLCFHGSPRSYDEVLLPETPADDLRRALQGADASVMCGGHTHLQWTTTVDGRCFFNPGSVGLAYNRHLPRERFYFYPVAEFAVLAVRDGSVRLEFCQVPFDLDAFESTIRASGHPQAEETLARYHPPS